jgi:hypothetical protein
MTRSAVVSTVLLTAGLVLIAVLHGGDRTSAGTPAPNVAGKWEGSWVHREASGHITLQLTQKGTTVTGKSTVTGFVPVVGEGPGPRPLGEEVLEGTLEGTTLIFHVDAPDGPSGQVNFTLTVGKEAMTGTACGYTCATLKLKKAKI